MELIVEEFKFTIIIIIFNVNFYNKKEKTSWEILKHIYRINHYKKLV